MAVVQSPHHPLGSPLAHSLHSLFHSLHASAEAATQQLAASPKQRWPWQHWRRRSSAGPTALSYPTSEAPPRIDAHRVMPLDAPALPPATVCVPDPAPGPRTPPRAPSGPPPLPPVLESSPTLHQPRPLVPVSSRIGLMAAAIPPDWTAQFDDEDAHAPPAPAPAPAPAAEPRGAALPRRKPLFSFAGDQTPDIPTEEKKDPSSVSPDTLRPPDPASERGRPAVSVRTATSSTAANSVSPPSLRSRPGGRKVSFTYYSSSPADSVASQATSVASADSADFAKGAPMRRSSSGLSALSARLAAPRSADPDRAAARAARAAAIRRRQAGRGWDAPGVPLFEGRVNLAAFEAALEPMMAPRARSRSEADLRRRAAGAALGRAHASHQGLSGLGAEETEDGDADEPAFAPRGADAAARRRGGALLAGLAPMEPLPPATPVSPTEDAARSAAARPPLPRALSSEGGLPRLSSAGPPRLSPCGSAASLRSVASAASSSSTALPRGLSSPSLGSTEGTLVDPAWRARSLQARTRAHAGAGAAARARERAPDVEYGDAHAVW